jgi:hypothetical protein
MKRGRWRSDPLWRSLPRFRGWFDAEPWRASRELFERLLVVPPANSRTAGYER